MGILGTVNWARHFFTHSTCGSQRLQMTGLLIFVFLVNVNSIFKVILISVSQWTSAGHKKIQIYKTTHIHGIFSLKSTNKQRVSHPDFIYFSLGFCWPLRQCCLLWQTDAGISVQNSLSVSTLAATVAVRQQMTADHGGQHGSQLSACQGPFPVWQQEKQRRGQIQGDIFLSEGCTMDEDKSGEIKMTGQDKKAQTCSVGSKQNNLYLYNCVPIQGLESAF